MNSPFVPDPIILDPEIVETREIGLRSDFLDQRLRFNATLFRFAVGRAARAEDDSTTRTTPVNCFRQGDSDRATEWRQTSGLEVELFYVPGERWELDFSLGLLDSEYLDIGDPPANGTGLQPGIPLQYAPEQSFSLGLRYRLPLARGGELLFAGNYGWMDDYQRAAAERVPDAGIADGSNRPEPAYGVLNARVVYRTPRALAGLAVRHESDERVVRQRRVRHGSLLGLRLRHRRPAARSRRGPAVRFRLMPALRTWDVREPVDEQELHALAADAVGHALSVGGQ